MKPPFLALASVLLAFVTGHQLARTLRDTPSTTAPVGAGHGERTADDVPPALDEAGLRARLANGDLSRDEILQAEFRRLAAADPAKALLLAQSLGEGKATALGIVFAAMAMKDAEGAWQQIMALENSTDFDFMMRGFLREMVALDRLAAIRLIDAHPESESLYIDSELISNAQPVAAVWLPILKSVRRTNLCCHMLRYLSLKWPAEDLPGLLALHSAIPADYETVMLGNNQFSGGKALGYWIEHQPQRAADMLAALPAGTLHTDAWKEFTAQLARAKDPALLQDMLRSSHGAEIQEALVTVALHYSLDAGRRAALPALLPEGEGRLKVIEALAQEAAENFDIHGAENFLDQLPPDRGGAVYRKLAERWNRDQPAGAEAWLQSLPAGSMERDWAQVGMIEDMLSKDPAQAAAQVDTIQNHTARIDAIKRVAATWRFRDHAALETWLNQRPEITPIQRMEWSGKPVVH